MNTQVTSSRRGFGLLGFFMAVGLIASALILAVTFHAVAPVSNRIEVKGYAEEPITSDAAVWRGMFAARGLALRGAYAELGKERDQVIGYLTGLGIKADTLRFSTITTSPNLRPGMIGSRGGQADGYLLTQRFEVVSNDVNLIDKLSKESMDLIKKGVEFTSFPPQFYYTQINSKKLDLLGAATRDAKARADQLAQNSGSRVGRLISASQGVFQVTPLYSTETSQYNIYDTSTIEKNIKAVVTADYSIE